MDDGKFWAFIWGTALTVIAIVAVCITTTIRSEIATELEMVKAGRSPIEASCAFADDRSPVCIAFVAKEKP